MPDGVNPTERGASHVHIGIAVAAGVAIGAALVLLAVQVFGATSVGKARRIHRQLVDDAEREAEALRREAQIESREQAIKLRADIDAEHADRRMQVLKIEERVLAKEEDVERKLVELQRKDQGLADREVHLRQLQDELKQAKATQQAEIERVAGMSLQEAKAHLLERGEELVRHDLARRVRMLEEEARAESKRRARNLVADALQRVAASHAAETTVTVIELPSDDMKGRIIGREGRNIRALEHLTGVDFIIDDTPHAVVLSSFDGLRREVARLTLTKLIEDGRIHPARIEEMYYQSKAEIEDVVRQAGEQAVFEANCGPFHEELVRILGRLRFRTSYGQNVLKHTLEVVHLAGIMATELGASVQTAKRAAMLHDLGKAMTHEIEGSHAAISAQFARRYGESQGVVHAVEAHHYEVQPQTVEAVLLISADAISASRPGARGESRALHQATRVARAAGRREAGRRQGLRAPGGPGDPRDRSTDGGRRRPRGAALARDRARDRGPARVPRPGEGDRDPRKPVDRRCAQPHNRVERRRRAEGARRCDRDGAGSARPGFARISLARPSPARREADRGFAQPGRLTPRRRLLDILIRWIS
jgi:ribonuclease Y